jgi:hypothetical protein
VAFETLALVFKEVYGVAEVAEKLQVFVQDRLFQFLLEVGRTDYNAAIQSLENAKKSGQPSREIGLAIGHLESAYQKFIRAASGKGLKGYLASLLSDRQISSYQASCEAALIIAACYAALGEERLKNEYISKSSECFGKMADAYLSKQRIFCSMPSPHNLPGGSPLSMSGPEQEIRSLREDLTKIHGRLRTL